MTNFVAFDLATVVTNRLKKLFNLVDEAWMWSATLGDGHFWS
jgi:hypothetical protein